MKFSPAQLLASAPFLALLAAAPLQAQQEAAVAEVIDEGLGRSQAQMKAHELMDRIGPDDLRQAATVMVGVLLQAATSEKTLAREPLPQRPTDTAPFEWKYPDED